MIEQLNGSLFQIRDERGDAVEHFRFKHKPITPAYMKEGDFGYVVIKGKVRHAKVMTVSGCGRYFTAFYHIAGKLIKSCLPVASFFKSEFDAEEDMKNKAIDLA